MLRGGTFNACAIVGTAVFNMVVSSDSMKNPTATNQGNSRLAVSLKAVWSRACTASGAGERRIDDELRLGKQPVQMAGVVKTLCVNLVDVLGPRRSCGEPAAV